MSGFSIESILNQVGKIPGARIDREDYLVRTFYTYVNKDESVRMPEILKDGPVKAGVLGKDIRKIAKSSINNEAIQATWKSVVAGVPGGLAMLATVPADTLQYFIHSFRIIQKLMYIYGWESNVFDDSGNYLDDETRNMIIIFLGIMFGVNTASKAFAKFALDSFSAYLRKNAAKAFFKKGIGPKIVKAILSKLGFKESVKIISGKSLTKIVPILSGLISGGLTCATFIPAANRLVKNLEKQRVGKFDEKGDIGDDDLK